MARIYIAGPMTGIPEYNAPAFRAAAKWYRDKGNSVVTPLETNSIVWMRNFGKLFDPTVDKCDYGDPMLDEMFIEDMKELAKARVVVLLPGWQASKGARVEAQAAFNLQKLVVEHDSQSVVRNLAVSIVADISAPKTNPQEHPAVGV